MMQRQQYSIISESALSEAAACLKVLAHKSRLQLLQLLLSGEYSVGELANKCKLKPHVASEHLRTMERCRFIVGQRKGKEVFYRVIESHIEDILACIRNRFGEK